MTHSNPYQPPETPAGTTDSATVSPSLPSRRYWIITALLTIIGWGPIVAVRFYIQATENYGARWLIILFGVFLYPAISASAIAILIGLVRVLRYWLRT